MKAFPQAHISVLLKKQLKGCLEAQPFVSSQIRGYKIADEDSPVLCLHAQFTRHMETWLNHVSM